VGAYDKDRLANLGLGHGAIDVGGAYTYFNPMNGLEFSATSGFTFNFINTHTGYQKVSIGTWTWRFPTFSAKNCTSDSLATSTSRSPATEARVRPWEISSLASCLGPEIGYFIPAGSMKAYLNLKGYSEFAAENRPSGWNFLAEACTRAGNLKRKITDWPKVHLFRAPVTAQLNSMAREVAARKFEVHPTIGDHFAWLRTRLALERTLMSWVKSATGLIAFGFTIVQVLERLRKENAAIPVLDSNLPRNLGLALSAMGVVNLAVGIVQYRKVVGYLWCSDFKSIAGVSEKPHKTPLVGLAFLVEIVGVVVFVTVLLRLS